MSDLTREHDALVHPNGEPCPDGCDAGPAPRTAAQRARQDIRHRDHGRYAKVNPCYVCGKSAGIEYFPHHETDVTIGDKLLVLCRNCADATEAMSGPDAVAWAVRTHPDTYAFAPTTARTRDERRCPMCGGFWSNGAHMRCQ